MTLTKPPATKRREATASTAGDAARIRRVYGYCRVSTVQQADDGQSLEVQQRQIEGHAMQHGWTLAKIFVERGVSGSKPLDERPEGSALIHELRKGDIVITPKLDRMFRSAQNALEMLSALKQNGISLHMLDLGGDVTGNGVSRLVFTILSAVAENERERTRERIAEVKADQKKRGRYLGGIEPFGFRRGVAGELVPVPEQQKALKRMQRLRGQGRSLREIAAALGTEGIKLSHVGVKNVLAAASRPAAT